MFRCHFCHEITPPGTKKRNVVIATRDKTYPARGKDIKRSRGRFQPRSETGGDSGGKGVETLQEVPACPACVAKQEAKHEAELRANQIAQEKAQEKAELQSVAAASDKSDDT